MNIISNRPGIWRRAGMEGLVTGLDLNEAMAALPDGVDRELSRQLLVTAETAFVAAHQRRREEEAEKLDD